MPRSYLTGSVSGKFHAFTGDSVRARFMSSNISRATAGRSLAKSRVSPGSAARSYNSTARAGARFT